MVSSLNEGGRLIVLVGSSLGKRSSFVTAASQVSVLIGPSLTSFVLSMKLRLPLPEVVIELAALR